MKKYLNEVALRRFEPTTPQAPVGARYRYLSGVTFADDVAAARAFALGSVKIAGQEGSKIAGQEGSKIAGQEGSKLAGQEGSKLASGGSSNFFESIRLFKNIESRWDISGFSKRPADRG